MKTTDFLFFLICGSFLAGCTNPNGKAPDLSKAQPGHVVEEMRTEPTPKLGTSVPEPVRKSLDPDEVFQKASKSIVEVLNPEAGLLGSGVEIRDNVFVTNCHVLKGGSDFYVKRDGHKMPASLLKASLNQDICLLSVEDIVAHPAEVRSSVDLRIGERVYAVGNPQGFELTISEGIISQLRASAPDEPYPYIQTTAPISEGSSGGGIFDTYGRLIGISSFMFKEGQNLNFAAPIDWARELLGGPVDSIKSPRAVQSLMEPNVLGSRALNTQAIARIDAGQIPEAIDLLEKAESASSLDAEILGNLGYTYMLSGRFNEARDKFMLALTISPKRAATWLNLGQTFAELDAPDLALESVKRGYYFASRKEAVRKALLKASIDPVQSAKWRAVASDVLTQL